MKGRQSRTLSYIYRNKFLLYTQKIFYISVYGNRLRYLFVFKGIWSRKNLFILIVLTVVIPVDPSFIVITGFQKICYDTNQPFPFLPIGCNCYFITVCGVILRIHRAERH